MPTVTEVLCDCGATLAVFTRDVPRPLVQCPRCGDLADGEPPSTATATRDLFGYDEDGPDVQVVVQTAP